MSGSEKCCFCLPLDCGAKTIAALTIISTVMTITSAFIEEDGWAFYWSLITVQLIMSVFWVAALVSPSVTTKTAAFWAYLVLIVFAANTIYSYLIYSGELAIRVCT